MSGLESSLRDLQDKPKPPPPKRPVEPKPPAPAEVPTEGLFEVPVALGTISNLEREATAALEPAYQEARKAVANAPVKNIDETGWKRSGLKRWLWAAATKAATVFLIHPRRNLDALTHLLVKLAGILVSDPSPPGGKGELRPESY